MRTLESEKEKLRQEKEEEFLEEENEKKLICSRMTLGMFALIFFSLSFSSIDNDSILSYDQRIKAVTETANSQQSKINEMVVIALRHTNSDVPALLKTLYRIRCIEAKSTPITGSTDNLVRQFGNPLIKNNTLFDDSVTALFSSDFQAGTMNVQTYSIVNLRTLNQETNPQLNGSLDFLQTALLDTNNMDVRFTLKSQLDIYAFKVCFLASGVDASLV